MEKFIQQISIDLSSNLMNFASSDIKINSYKIDCSKLDKRMYSKDFRFKSNDFKSLFFKIKNINKPVLYWFSIQSDVDREFLVDKAKVYKNRSNSKAIPAIKNTIDFDSNVLYVGKVKKGFLGRVTQHLGFSKSKKTQGLQLFYWAKELNLKLDLNYIVFDEALSDAVSLFELEVARNLKPLLGKHR